MVINNFEEGKIMLEQKTERVYEYEKIMILYHQNNLLLRQQICCNLLELCTSKMKVQRYT